MGTIDTLEERIKHIKLEEKLKHISKACPICGAAPRIVSVDLGGPDGHGYPGCVDIHLECSGCGVIKAGSYDTICNKYDEAKELAIEEWNGVVDYINNLIEQKNKRGQ